MAVLIVKILEKEGIVLFFRTLLWFSKGRFQKMKFLSVAILVLSSVFSSFAESYQLSEDLILTLPTGEFGMNEFVKKVEDLNPFLNIVVKGQPKSNKISFSSGSRFKTVFRNLNQFEKIVSDFETKAGGAPKFELLDDRLTITWSKGSASESVATAKRPSAPIKNLKEPYRINGKLVIDEYLKYDLSQPVVVDGDLVINESQTVEFGDLTINGKLTLSKGSRVKAQKVRIAGAVIVSEGATVETVDVIFDGEGDLVLNENSTLLLTDGGISAE